MYREDFMSRAIEISREALEKPGTEPFGCVIVKDGVIVGEGLNHSLAHFDPTSHGEVEAIRDACRRLECVDLTGCDLYTSCEPCAMCVATMEVAGISTLYYAASMRQAGVAFAALTRAERHPIDAEALRIAAGAPVEERAMPSRQAMDAEAVAILESWATARKAATGRAG
ncbi:nucleoside deaminase [Ancylobacter oerskovii]|uniref:Nucleoside deaminase n=1 Tax=Ancylobacter oerskovii TaxID=459519 RepID=A0ABW4Z0P6_9HYPH|nr:nucleoside deaminase [Ancylobacter oerskovii]MBS7542785.1 nucleoside deaminase [Ancylobacter oerskovii]